MLKVKDVEECDWGGKGVYGKGGGGRVVNFEEGKERKIKSMREEGRD